MAHFRMKSLIPENIHHIRERQQLIVGHKPVTDEVLRERRKVARENAIAGIKQAIALEMEDRDNGDLHLLSKYGIKPDKYYKATARIEEEYKNRAYTRFPKANLKEEAGSTLELLSTPLTPETVKAIKTNFLEQAYGKIDSVLYRPHGEVPLHRRIQYGRGIRTVDYAVSDRASHRITFITRDGKEEYFNAGHSHPYYEKYGKSEDLQVNGTCSAFSTLRGLCPELSNEEFVKKLNEASDRTGLTPEEVVVDVLRQMQANKGVERVDVLPNEPRFKKGGVVFAKESYKKEPKSIGDYELVKQTPTMLLYKKGDEFVVAIRGTAELEDIKADLSLPFNKLSTTGRYKKDLAEIKKWKEEYPEGTWTGVGHSLGGAIMDEFIKEGLITGGTSYNPAIQPFNIRKENERIHAEGDPLLVPMIGSKVVEKRVFNPHSLENFPEDNIDKEEMRHIKTDVPLVEGGKKFLGGEGGKQVIEKVKKEAKKHSHHLKEVGKGIGAKLGEAGGEALARSIQMPVEIAKKAGKAVGEKLGEFVGEKAHSAVQSLKKGGVVTDITHTKPAEHKAAVEKKKGKKKVEVVIVEEVKAEVKPKAKVKAEVKPKKTNSALKEVQAIRKAKGVSLKEAWAAYKSK